MTPGSAAVVTPAQGDHPPSAGVMAFDDNDLVGEALSRLLRRASGLHWLGLVSPPRDLLAQVRQHGPEVLLMDIDVPGVDTFEALRQIRSHCPATRIAMFTGHIRRDMIEESLRHGASAYLSKDLSPDELIDALRRISAGEQVLSSQARRMLNE